MTKRVVIIAWIVFASVNAFLTFKLPGRETIPYHLIWASFALLYGLWRWSKVVTWTVFWLITVVTGIALVGHAYSGVIGWEECAEIVLMAVILAMLVWHVNRQWSARALLVEIQAEERRQTEQRELASRFGSHEVRTRLTIARGYAELIASSATDPETRSDVGILVSELDKASALATNLLTLVRVVQPSHRSPVDVDQLIAVVVRRWSVTADRNWTATSTVGVIIGDSEQLEATLDCLIENAVKFTDPGDVIAVAAQAEGSSVVMSVRDSGTGIPPADVGRIFELFQTSSTAGDRAGSGLGLAIVRAITESRGGTVEVDSTLGVGTTFTLKFSLTRPARSHRGLSYQGSSPDVEFNAAG